MKHYMIVADYALYLDTETGYMEITRGTEGCRYYIGDELVLVMFQEIVKLRDALEQERKARK